MNIINIVFLNKRIVRSKQKPKSDVNNNLSSGEPNLQIFNTPSNSANSKLNLSNSSASNSPHLIVIGDVLSSSPQSSSNNTNIYHHSNNCNISNNNISSTYIEHFPVHRVCDEADEESNSSNSETSKPYNTYELQTSLHHGNESNIHSNQNHHQRHHHSLQRQSNIDDSTLAYEINENPNRIVNIITGYSSDPNVANNMDTQESTFISNHHCNQNEEENFGYSHAPLVLTRLQNGNNSEINNLLYYDGHQNQSPDNGSISSSSSSSSSSMSMGNNNSENFNPHSHQLNMSHPKRYRTLIEQNGKNIIEK